MRPHSVLMNIRTLIVAGLAGLSSCSISDPLPKQQPLYDVSYSGNLIIGDSISFQSSAPANSVFHWTFSNGTESFQAQPRIAFYKSHANGAAIADDTVILVVNNALYRPNIKTFRLKPPVPRVIGNRAWKGGYQKLYGKCCPGLVPQPLNDTTFNTIAIDENTVATWSNNIPWLADSAYFSNERRVGRHNATTLRYTKDTLFFSTRTGNDTSWIEYSWYHKYQ